MFTQVPPPLLPAIMVMAEPSFIFTSFLVYNSLGSYGYPNSLGTTSVTADLTHHNPVTAVLTHRIADCIHDILVIADLIHNILVIYHFIN